MILIFSYKKTELNLGYIISKYYKKKLYIVDKFIKHYFDKAIAIIPLGIKSQKELNKYTKYKHKFMVNDTNIYDMLDDKILFYNFVKKNNILKGTDIKLIKSYTQKYNGINIYGNFLLKHRNGAGSAYNKIKTDWIYNIINKYSENNQIQKIIDIKIISGVNGICKDGEIIQMFDFIMPNFDGNDYYFRDNDEILDNVKPQCKKVISRILKKVNYNGFFEIEFAIDKNWNVYLLECNPRISGNIRTTAIENNVVYSPFVKHFIIPYCEIIEGKNPTLVKKINKINTKFYGTEYFPESKYHNETIIFI